MPALKTPDIERLLSPISSDAPAGASLRRDAIYDRIREARREDDATIPQGVWQRPLKVADYGAVVALAEEALRTRSKDLQLAAWLGDAWAQLFEIDGATAALDLCAGLLERYWEELFPLLDDGDPEPRARIVDWLDDALARRLRLAKLGNERTSITYADWERAGAEATSDEEEAPVTREALLARMSLVDAGRWSAVRASVRAAAAAVARLDQAFEARAPDLRPPPRATVVLRGMEALLAEVLRDVPEPPAAPEAPELAELAERAPRPAAATPGPVTGGGGIQSRAEAYQRLTEAADYLLRTEPHSPVPYLVKRAVAWGNMPLTELMQEFITSADDLVSAHRLLGMRPRGE